VVVSTNEPFWQATVEGDTVILRGVDASERRLTGARASMTADGRRIDASDAQGSLVLIVRRMRCEDDMSGARFPMTGLLTIDGRGPFHGCARPASMPPPAPPVEEDAQAPAATMPDGFVGSWDADAKACRDSSEYALKIEPRALHFFESVAVPRSVSARDDGSIRVEADYSGMGDTWAHTLLMRLDGAHALVIEDHESGDVRRVRCDE